MPLPLLGLIAALGGTAALGQGVAMPWLRERERKRESGIREGILAAAGDDPAAQAEALMSGGLLDEAEYLDFMTGRLDEQGRNTRFGTEQERLNSEFGIEQERLGSVQEDQSALDWERYVYGPERAAQGVDRAGNPLPIALDENTRKTVERTDSALDVVDRFSNDLEAYDATNPLTFPGTEAARQKSDLQTGLARSAGEIVMNEAYRRSGGNEPSAEVLDQVRREFGFPEDFTGMMPGELPAIRRTVEGYRGDLIRAREGVVQRNVGGVPAVDQDGTVGGDQLRGERPAAAAPATAAPAAQTPRQAPQEYNYPAYQQPERQSRAGGPPPLLASESGGDWGATNDEGMVGRVQFSPARLSEARQALGVDFTAEEFRQSPKLQKAAERWHFNDIATYIQRTGLEDSVGRRIKGVPVTIPGLIYAAHIGGKAGMKKYVESGGAYDPADSNGTRISDYVRMGARQIYG